MEQPEANVPSAAAAAPPEDPAAANNEAASAPTSPTPSDDMMSRRKKEVRKKRKVVPPGSELDDDASRGSSKQPKKKPKRKDTKKEDKKKVAKNRARAMIPSAPQLTEHMSAAQLAVNEQMRRALEEDKYSALGSIVDTDSDEDDADYPVYGGTMHIDRATIMNAMKKRLWMASDEQEEEEKEERRAKKKRKKAKRAREEGTGGAVAASTSATPVAGAKAERVSPVVKPYTDHQPEEDHDHIRDGGSIFGQTAGASNATWVECDKCKKWRRLRGVVDEKKLPSKWYCSMNKNDPERARCSAPEEEYDTQKTPENAADARTRKHLRIWVRRLQANEAYESRQPTMTRGKKRSAAVSSKEPYEWVRCCNPSCGKWRAVLRIMDAKTHVIDRTTDGEWYCVMNTWDEKTASCAAPQENLPAIGCPPWVMQDDN